MTGMLLVAQSETGGNVVVEAGKKVLESGKEATTQLVEAGKLAGDATVANVTDVTSNAGQQLTAAGQETWQTVAMQVTQVVGSYLPNLAAGLVILVVGWFVALLVAWLARAAVGKLGIDKRLAGWVDSVGPDNAPDVSRSIGSGVFWITMLFVGVGFFQALGLTMVTEPLQAFLNQVFQYAPRIIAAAVLLAVAWVVARASRLVVVKALTTAQIDRRLTQEAGVADDEGLPLTKTISEATYWLVYLLFLPALLDALAVPGLLAPVQDVVGQVLGFLPNLFGAAVTFGIGWLVARIVQRVVVNLLAAAGADRLSDRVGLAAVLGDKKLSAAVGLLAYVMILVPVIIGSLNALEIAAVTQPASEMLNTILSSLPGVMAALLVVGVAYVVGRVISDIAVSLLAGVGFDNLPSRLGLAAATPEGGRTPSQIAGTIVMVAIVLFATMQALPMLGFDLLAAMMSDFLGFASHVLVGLAIFGFGLFFAKLVADMIRDAKIANHELLATVARAAILVLAGAMGLEQMGLAQETVNLAFGITLGAVAVASAIAFGIGGREAAKQLIDRFLESRGQENLPRHASERRDIKAVATN